MIAVTHFIKKIAFFTNKYNNIRTKIGENYPVNPIDPTKFGNDVPVFPRAA